MSKSTAEIPQLDARGAPSVSQILELGQASAFALCGYRAYGPVFKIGLYGPVVITGVDINRRLIDERSAFLSAMPYRGAQCEALGAARTMLSLNGDEHDQWRRSQRDAYGRTSIERRYRDVCDLIQSHVARWHATADVSIADEMQRLVAELLALVLYDSVPEVLPNISTYVNTVVGASGTGVLNRSLLDTPAFRDSERQMRTWADALISDGPKSTCPHAKHNLVAAVSSPSAEALAMSEQERRVALVATPYLGGWDSTAATLSFLLLALMQRPALLAEVAAEVRANWNADDPACLNRLTLCRRVMLETLRRYPVFPIIQGNAARDLTIEGYQVAKGQALIIGIAVPHFLQECFENPLTFDPGRFDHTTHDRLGAGQFVPFGVGEHVCQGAGLAESMILTVIASILDGSNIETCDLDQARAIRIRGVVVPCPAPDHRMRIQTRATEAHVTSDGTYTQEAL
jgi:cytochrome P450